MDHQWGNFVAAGWGGWDWYGGQLADGRDVALFAGRDRSGVTVITYGTLVGRDGVAKHLAPDAIAIEPVGEWTSPRTAIRYPSGWRVRVPDERLDLLWLPQLDDQELDTRASTGVVYWEGAVALLDAGTRAELGRGYVELTGYGGGT
jgi:predicted secreted hydrolase